LRCIGTLEQRLFYLGYSHPKVKWAKKG